MVPKGKTLNMFYERLASGLFIIPLGLLSFLVKQRILLLSPLVLHDVVSQIAALTLQRSSIPRFYHDLYIAVLRRRIPYNLGHYCFLILVIMLRLKF
jgi:hypothetical protein